MAAALARALDENTRSLRHLAAAICRLNTQNYPGQDDMSSTRTYSGTGITCGGWTAAGSQSPQADDNDLTDDQDPNAIRLEGITGQNEFTASGGDGMHKGERVPNLDITHVSKPAQTRGLPADHQTNQNPLGAAKPTGAAAAARGRRYSG